MGKILESLKLTIITGVILTVIMVFVTDMIYDSQMSAPEAVANDLINKM